MKYNIAVVGATGVVGRKMIEMLEEFNIPINHLYLFASSKSAGTKISFMGQDYEVAELTENNVQSCDIDYALFSAGKEVSSIFAPLFAKKGIVIDNSSCFRMDKDVPLVVPEVNSEDCSTHKNIIANPNCSTIQAVVALNPLHKKYKLKRVVYSTYQAVSGAGKGGIDDLVREENGGDKKHFFYPIYRNIIPQIDDFLDDGYTKEELKMINETRKILHANNLPITATTVRVPVMFGHAISINAEFENDFELSDVKDMLSKSEGIVYIDEKDSARYPTPLMVENKNEVYVGRVRRDNSVKYGLNLWVVADNIRKGAATNAVQILKYFLAGEKHEYI